LPAGDISAQHQLKELPEQEHKRLKEKGLEEILAIRFFFLAEIAN